MVRIFKNSGRFALNTKLWVGIIIFLAALVPRIFTLGQFYAPDEQHVWLESSQFTLALIQGNLAGTVTSIYPAVPLMWLETLVIFGKYVGLTLTQSGGVAWSQVFGPDLPLNLLAERRLALIVVHLVLTGVIWFWLDELFGRTVAFLAGLLIALDAFFLAESRVIRVDALNSEFIFLSLLALLLYFKRDQRRFLLFSGGLAGLAALTKMSAAFLLPFVGLVLAAWLGWAGYRQRQYKPALWQIFGAYTQWLAAFGVVFVGLWPVLWTAPLTAFDVLWGHTQRVGEGGFDGRGVFFWGQIYPDDPGAWFYPVSLVFRVSPFVLPGLLLLIPVVSRRLARLKEAAKPNLLMNLGVMAIFVVSYLAFMSMLALKYDRYLLPVFPALNVIAVLGLWYFVVDLIQLIRLSQRAITIAAVALSVFVLAVQGVINYCEHPYYYTYYNPLLGGTARAAEYIRIGFSEGFDQVGRYLSQLPHSEQLKVASAKSQDLGYYFPGKPVPLDNLSGQWVQADYVFIYISQFQRGKHDLNMLDYLARRKPEYELIINGFKYGTLYPGPAVQHYAGGQKLEGRGTLYGYNLSTAQLNAGDTLTTTLYWRNEGQQPGDAFFVKIVDAAGYLWSSTTAQPRPDFVEASRMRGAIVESEASLALPVGMPPGQYFLKMGFTADKGQTWVGDFALPAGADTLAVTAPSSFPQSFALPGEFQTTPLVTTDLSLLGYNKTPTAPRDGWLTLLWRAEKNAPRDYVINLRLLDATGHEVAYWLGRPVYSGYATPEWRRGQMVQDPWQLVIPAQVAPGDYQLELRLFDAVTQQVVAQAALGNWTVTAP